MSTQSAPAAAAQAAKPRAVGIMAIDDGYTLSGCCRDESGVRQPLRFKYRPALPEAVYEYRIQSVAAKSGQDRLSAVLAILAAHVESWDGVYRADPNTRVPVSVPFKAAGDSATALADPAVRRGVGVDYIDQMINHVTGYTAGEWEADAKNS